jgi:cytochrome c1
LPLDTVTTDTVSPVSAMPEGLLDALTAQEVADLLAYLSRLKSKP